MLFMKGNPAEPRCGFSAKVVGALQQAGIDFTHFDILSDDGVRQGLKVNHLTHACLEQQVSANCRMQMTEQLHVCRHQHHDRQA